MTMKVGKYVWLSLMVVLAIIVVSACGGEEKQETSSKEPTNTGAPTPTQEGDSTPEPEPIKENIEPVVLKIYNNSTSEATFQRRYIDPIAKKYPQITLEVLFGSDQRLPELIAGGTIPDIAQGGGPTFAAMLNDLDFPESLDPFIKRFNFDLSSFNPAVVPTLKAQFNSSELLALPAGVINHFNINYNKTVFDRFGVSYPTDDMTWDELYALAKRLTVLDQGVQYRGFDFQIETMMQNNPLSLPLVNPETNEAMINTEGWKQYFDQLRQFYEIPGNFTKVSGVAVKRTELINGELAMLLIGPIAGALETAETEVGLEWDMIKMPSFTDQGTGLQLLPPFFSMSKQSQHKDAAFQVLAAILDLDVMMANSTAGDLTISLDPQVREVFAADRPLLRSKNVNAILDEKAADPQPYFTEYDSIATSELIKGFNKAVTENIDTNTILRMIEEEVNAKIKAELK